MDIINIYSISSTSDPVRDLLSLRQVLLQRIRYLLELVSLLPQLPLSLHALGQVDFSVLHRVGQGLKACYGGFCFLHQLQVVLRVQKLQDALRNFLLLKPLLLAVLDGLDLLAEVPS
jgi:hypothetical protein